MKKIIIAFLVFINLHNYQAQSRIFESLSMPSELLNVDVKYSVYLPDGYDTSESNYPVVYLLNGFTGNETDWIYNGTVKNIADELIQKKKIIPMIIVMPDGDDRLYMNKDDGSYPYETMLIDELLPFIESSYRINKTKQYRAISGLSMGGSGSLRLALKYHDVFGHCAAFSAGISTNEEIINETQDSFDSYFGRVSPSIIGKKGKDRLTATMMDYDVLELVKSKDPDVLKSVNLYFDCGDDDFLTIGNSQLHIELVKRKIPHEFRMRNGAHTWDYWRDSLPEGLQFISNMIRK
ncbi:alpha/beta hydrolase [Psychroserpens sp.]|uniref:alpha/beta hydrolase n=1 Tax=Psychroserpens sp. TaxID=2020870 RepID=UPI001B2BFD92|nr:alpha/beta hydrolase-fold protein [Psychroserpens sp.]MBO6606070.1 esterase family protein [Psychroserpens sp.]MBO6631605.1 esterase family protein [Psychroserpens sp.]MBO6652559.1 esterase family protein [Psychroserpens sp.]MBO6681669.1 esterase family protein [Psychroserpens sp.]MBO6749444.1 esterase family protein [Psychroserpens sp.]